MVRRFVLALAVLALGGVLTCWAQETEAPCDVDGIIDRRSLQREVERLDRELDELVEKIRSELRRDLDQAAADPELHDPPGLEWYERRIANLDQTQQAWLAFRKAACDEAYYLFFGGSMAGPSKAICLVDTTTDRIRQIEGMYQHVIEDM